MVVGLSDFLRRAIDSADSPEVTLASELEYLHRYLAIQQMRFLERLRVNIEIPAELLPALVPSLMLQPLVENAIKHGIAKRALGGCIHITASLTKGNLNLTICNDGPPLRPDWETSSRGIGLANLRSRMQLLYGSAFELALRDDDTHRVRALVTVPFSQATPFKVA
jgi:LytS/YehU family sensor histidine kinase